MPYRYSTALSHIILAATGVYCLLQIKGQPLHCPHISFGIIILTSVIGVWRWGNPDYGYKAYRLYASLTQLQLLFAMPCITTTVWLANGYDKNYSLAWVLLPLCCFLFNAMSDLEDLILLCNVIALSGASFLSENYYGIATATSFVIDYYCVLKQGSNYDIPAQDLFNYGLCFFAYFALRTSEECF